MTKQQDLVWEIWKSITAIYIELEWIKTNFNELEKELKDD